MFVEVVGDPLRGGPPGWMGAHQHGDKSAGEQLGAFGTPGVVIRDRDGRQAARPRGAEVYWPLDEDDHRRRLGRGMRTKQRPAVVPRVEILVA